MSQGSTARASIPAASSSRWRRGAVRLGVVGLTCYLGVIIVLLALESRFVYHPVTAQQDWQPPPASIRAADVELQTADGTMIHAWWCPTENWQPAQGAVLFSHGNAGNLSHRAESVRRWQEFMGLAVLIFDYPGYGKSGGKPSETGCHASARAAYDWLVNDRKIPPERVVLLGGSLGGAMAVELATQFPHRALVLVSTFTSVPDMAQKTLPWLPARWLVRHRFDNLAKIGQCRAPVFIAHGTADQLVPFSQGERLYTSAPEPKCFLPMEGYDHHHSPGPEFYEKLRTFLNK